MNDHIKDNIQNKATWKRVLFIVIFWLIFNLVELVIAVLVVFQVLASLFSGEPNQRVLELSDQLSRYAYRILQYVTFNSDDRPFPFSDWDQGNNIIDVK